MTDIKDIKPDTSLYSRPEDRIIAFGMVMKLCQSGRAFEYRGAKEGKFTPITNGSVSLITRLELLLTGDDYRIKPEPRVVWVNFYGGHPRAAFCYDSEETAKAEASIRTFATAVRVELPE